MEMDTDKSRGFSAETVVRFTRLHFSTHSIFSSTHLSMTNMTRMMF
jgi:hypothetical protein